MNQNGITHKNDEPEIISKSCHFEQSENSCKSYYATIIKISP